MFDFMSELNKELQESGELVGAHGLTEPARARHVSVDADGRPVVTDRPYADDDVRTAGFWVLECESLERVTEIAERIARCPQPEGAPEHPVVIRPVQGGIGGV
jgi:hypothetical protein